MQPANSTSTRRSEFVQDCSRCRLLRHCWTARHTDWEVQAHLLVCRLHTGDKTAQDLLIAHIGEEAEACIRRVGQAHDLEDLGIDVEDMVQEGLIEALRYLQEDFILGDRMTIWRRLFDWHGLLASWTRNHYKTLRRNNPRPAYIEDIEGFDVASPDSTPEDDAYDREVENAIERACLSPRERIAVEHVLYSDGVPRDLRNRRVTGAQKMLTVLGAEENLPVPGNARRRLAWALGESTWALTRSEREDILKALERGASKGALGWAFGVSVAVISSVADHRHHDRT